jgi:hypothetical protein
MAKKSTKKSPNAVMAMPAADIDWRAQDDCRALQRSQEIMADAKRHSAAKKHAAKEAKMMAKVAGGKK